MEDEKYVFLFGSIDFFVLSLSKQCTNGRESVVFHLFWTYYAFRLQVQQSVPLACGWGSTPRPKACLKEKMHRMCFTQVCCFRLMNNNPLYYCLAQLPRFGSLKLHWSVNICLCRCLHPDWSWRTDDGGGFSGMLWCNPGVTLHAGTGLYLFLILFVYLPIRSKSIILTYFMA